MELSCSGWPENGKGGNLGKTNKHSSPTTSLKGHLDYRIKKEGKEAYPKYSLIHQKVMLLSSAVLSPRPHMPGWEFQGIGGGGGIQHLNNPEVWPV